MQKLLIANRGVIARRIQRTARRLGVPSVAVYSDVDADSLHVREADEAVALGGSTPASTYLDAAKILNAARHTGATVIHPGYGFLSENAGFAELCESEGLAFAGPTSSNIRQFGLKNTARDLAAACRVPLLPGANLLESLDEAENAAESIGFPVMLKSAAGGGGIGMKICRHRAELRETYDTVRRLGEANFNDGGLFVEKYVQHARHIEVQVFGDGAGRVVTLGERDCSTQRRNQKLIEETPAPNLPQRIREELWACALTLARSVSYKSAGTIEFLYDAESCLFYFLEVNTRLQVEHAVTEEVFGVDLVEWMLRLALGDSSFLDTFAPTAAGASIQVRLYSEMPSRNFQPSTGTITKVRFPGSLRVETWVDDGIEVSAFYDPMIAKLVAKGSTREQALDVLDHALAQVELYGVESNQDYLRSILATPEFKDGRMTTTLLNSLAYVPSLIDVIEPGIDSLVVDWPGRTGYWHVGVPPSGPFDDLSFRTANRLLGNPEHAAGIEMTVRGPVLKFHVAATICLTGATMSATLDDAQVLWNRPFQVRADQILKIGQAPGPGMRAYLCIKGGFDEAAYLGSRTTFKLGLFGGHCGRSLCAGDALRLFPNCAATDGVVFDAPTASQPAWTNCWIIGVSYGPHGAPDFFTEADVDTFFSTRWEVHYNSSRTGVRLIGPKPQWARPDGGEAGLHPSNIHDNAYQVGAIDFTGDMPIILGPDGPSLGGFVCPATILESELWKVGQMRPGDTVSFHPVALDAALAAAASHHPITSLPADREPLFAHIGPERSPKVVYRRQGDTGLLVEYGDMILDLELRFRVQALYESLLNQNLPGLLDLTPGIRSLQVRFNPHHISFSNVQNIVRSSEEHLPNLADMAVPSRIVHLPLSWDDEATRLAIQKYMQSVRKDAPWCPSNIEFICRINGLDSIEEVKRIVFDASYLVMGLGDVYLGAPVATPVDPRHRLVTTKYNPARTWTPENAVGIGGAYLCIYGMEGPGGYQFVGRTVPVWNRYHITKEFGPGYPWLLRFFDQIRFYPVAGDELLQLRHDLIRGRMELKIEPTTFRLADYKRFLTANQTGISAFKTQQQRAFDEERARWKALGQDEAALQLADPEPDNTSAAIPPGCAAIHASVSGNLWKILAQPGDRVSSSDTVMIIESMKTEIHVPAGADGVIAELCATEGKPVKAGQTLAVIRDSQSEIVHSQRPAVPEP